MSERTSRSDRARDFEQAFEEMQRAFEAAVARSRPALISISENLTRIRSRISGAHQGLISIGAYMREHRSEIEALLNHLAETDRNVKNAKLLPEDHPLRNLWEKKIGRLPLGRYVEEELPYLSCYKKPPARPGRRKGTGPIVSDEGLLLELHARVLDGAKPTTAAQALLRKKGVPPDLLKNRADYLVRCYRVFLSKIAKNQPE